MTAHWAQLDPQKDSMAAFSSALESTPFSQSFGVGLQTSPTDYIPPSANVQATASMEGMGASLPLDAAALMNMPVGVGNMGGLDLQTMEQMEQQMDPSGMSRVDNLSAMSNSWSDLGRPDMEMFNYTEMQEMLAMQQQQSSPASHHTVPQQASFQAMGSGSSDAYLSDSDRHEVRSLSSSDNGWALIDPRSPPMGAAVSIWNPAEALHPRTSSQSSCSDEPHSRVSSLDGTNGSDVAPLSASSPTHSASDLISASDPEYGYDFERPSPPVHSTAPTLTQTVTRVHPIETHQAAWSTTATVGASAGTSPQRSPDSPVKKSTAKKQTLTQASSVNKAPVALTPRRRLVAGKGRCGRTSASRRRRSAS